MTNGADDGQILTTEATTMEIWYVVCVAHVRGLYASIQRRRRGCGAKRPYGVVGWGLRRSLLLWFPFLKPKFGWFGPLGHFCIWAFGFIGLELLGYSG
ncbi:hypothetical protein V6Z12_A05G386400 [Gossypium hirsutum]